MTVIDAAGNLHDSAGRFTEKAHSAPELSLVALRTGELPPGVDVEDYVSADGSDCLRVTGPRADREKPILVTPRPGGRPGQYQAWVADGSRVIANGTLEQTRAAAIRAAATDVVPGSHAKPDVVYWGVVRRASDGGVPLLMGSHYGVRVDLPEEDEYEYGRVFTTPEGASAHLAGLPATYTNGKPIMWEVTRIVNRGTNGWWYDA